MLLLPLESFLSCQNIPEYKYSTFLRPLVLKNQTIISTVVSAQAFAGQSDIAIPKMTVSLHQECTVGTFLDILT
jgi:hypothetical protein